MFHRSGLLRDIRRSEFICGLLTAMFSRYNASMAVDLWTAVINRTGQSKYPVEKAIEERAKARQLFVAAESEEEVERMQLSEDK